MGKATIPHQPTNRTALGVSERLGSVCSVLLTSHQDLQIPDARFSNYVESTREVTRRAPPDTHAQTRVSVALSSPRADRP